jgi:NADH-quinone oxidoreductase subunit J
MVETVFFILFAATAVVFALSVVLQRNPLYSALSLIVVIVSLAGLFVLLHAPFLAVLQIIIYAGAIMALFLFVIMMAEIGPDPARTLQPRSVFALILLLMIAGAAIWGILSAPPQAAAPAPGFSVRSLSRLLFTAYVFPFEAVAVLIVSAVVGSLFIARRGE